MSFSPYQGRKGPITDISIRYYEPDGTLGSPVCVSTPNDPKLNKGLSLSKVMAASSLGEMVLADQFVNTNEPTLGFTFPSFTPQTVGMREGLKPVVASAASDTWVVWGPRVIDKLIYPPAADATQEGFGVTAAPSAAVGSTLDAMGVSVDLALTGTYSATVPPTGTKTVAVGANMGLGFSTDLLGKYVTLWIPNNITGIVRLSEADPIERCQIDIAGVTRTLRIWHLRIFEALLKKDTGDFNLGEQQAVELAYSVVAAGRCVPYEWEWLPQARKC